MTTLIGAFHSSDHVRSHLQKGADVDVTRADGTTTVFRVDSVESYSKDAFPTATVYHDLTYSGLRLITCGGTFDPNKGSYENNIVAYATLKSVTT